MVHRDSAALTDKILEYVEGNQAFFLGIADEYVVESSDPTVAALSAVVGAPTG
jgi:hypothetical protein